MNTKKDFEIVASIISLIPAGKKRALAINKASAWLRQNPRFDRSEFAKQVIGKKERWAGIEKERKKVVAAVCAFGAGLSEKFHDRAKELIKQFSRFEGVKVHYLVMGMGGWSLHAVAPFDEEFDGKVERYSYEVNTYDFTTSRGQPIDGYERANPGICKVMGELDEILQFLTDEAYLSLLDIPEEEMKKLVGKK